MPRILSLDVPPASTAVKGDGTENIDFKSSSFSNELLSDKNKGLSISFDNERAATRETAVCELGCNRMSRSYK